MPTLRAPSLREWRRFFFPLRVSVTVLFLVPPSFGDGFSFGVVRVLYTPPLDLSSPQWASEPAFPLSVFLSRPDTPRFAGRRRRPAQRATRRFRNFSHEPVSVSSLPGFSLSISHLLSFDLSVPIEPVVALERAPFSP